MLEVRHITKSFVENKVLDDVSLKINSGELFVLLGPSGCGKTTLLRMLGGFESPDQGEIYLDGRRIDRLPPHQRSIHTVFQNYALFPHLSVRENIAFGPKILKLSKKEIDHNVNEALDIVRMRSFENSFPKTLSGGQKQRVALARALVNKPKVLLLDEPLSALDQKLRIEMQNELVILQRSLGITFVFVTHDQEEAMGLSDRICIMDKGTIQQIGQSSELYHKPENFFVAQFFGASNKVQLVLSEDRKSLLNPANQSIFISVGLLNDFEQEKIKRLPINKIINLIYRPEDVALNAQTFPQIELSKIKVRVDKIIFKGSIQELICLPVEEHKNINPIIIHTNKKLDEIGIKEQSFAFLQFKKSPLVFESGI